MHKVTKATSISKAVKEIVYIRDRGECVNCHRPGIPNAHVVRRSQLGKGIEQNVVCLCPECHWRFDQGKDPEFKEACYVRIVAHLKGFYPDWNREDMIYRKGDL